MKSLYDQGFTIQGTGGGCSAWVKQLDTDQFVVITSGCGSSHEFDIDMIVGIYDGSDDEGLWGNLIDSIEIDLSKGADDSKPTNPREFVATWGAGYATQETRTITLDDVSEDNGYPQENIFIVEALRVGETANLSDIGGDLTITRVK